MREGWKYKRLGDICESDLGKTLNQSKDDGEMCPYLCAINVQWDKIDLSTLKTARFTDIEQEKYSVRKGDLLICEGGDIGRAAIWDRNTPFQYQNALHRVRFNGPEYYSRFYLLYLLFLKNKGILDTRYGKGVTIQHLVKSSLLSIYVPVPPLPQQERIVAELDLLTGIIDKQKSQLKELDNLAQSIFYDMFGDPIENEKGWKVEKMGEVCTIERGGSPRPIEQYLTDAENGINWIKIGDATDGGMVITSTKQKIKPEGMKKSRYVHKGDFLLSNSMSFGRPYILGVDGCIHDGWLVIQDTKHVFNKIYLYYLLGSSQIYKAFQSMAVGGVVNNLNKDIVKAVRVAIPGLEFQESFAQKIQSIESQKAAINRSIAEIQKLFDYTMDKYFG